MALSTIAEIVLESLFRLIIKGRKDFGIVPINMASGAVASVLRYARYLFVAFVGSNVVAMLTHTGSEIDASLTYVLTFRVTAASLEIDTFLVERVGTGFVRTSQHVSQLRAGLRVKVYSIGNERAFELVIDRSYVGD